MSRSPRPSEASPSEPASTGIEGLDDVLCGGLTRNRLYLIEGVPGSGKTTLALQFLLEGLRHGEHVLCITLSETADELRAVAASHGWSLDGVELRELVPSKESLEPDEQYTVFHPSEMEFADTTKLILEAVQQVRPARVMVDSLSELRLLAGSSLRYRREILALKQFFSDRCCTVLLLDDLTAVDRDLQVHSIAHGVIQLDHLHPDYGADRRRLRVAKYRGVSCRSGYHDYVIRTGGLDVFPRLVAAEHRTAGSREVLGTGNAAFDTLLGGGIERGTSTLIVGAAGTGKSTLAAQMVSAAAILGRRSAMFAFDENLATLLSRTAGVGIPLGRHLEAGLVALQQVDPAELSPGELVQKIRRAVDRDGVALVVIDSLQGYLHAMPAERNLTIQLHELLMFLAQRGVATLMIGVHQGLIGGPMSTMVDASYLADTVIVLRYYELEGEVRQAISVVKRRSGAHERTIRDFRISSGGIFVGEPLRGLRGVFTGTPHAERPSP